MIAAALPHGGQHRNGHCQLERTGEVHHQHRERLVHVAREKRGQQRAAERIGYEAVGKAGRRVLGGGFELFRLLDHPDDAVIAPAAGRLFHANDARALLGDRSGIDEAALALGYRQRLARQGRLIDHRLAGDDAAVERDQAACAHDDLVARLDGLDGNERLGFAGFEPDLLHTERHRAGKVGNGLFVRPFL